MVRPTVLGGGFVLSTGSPNGSGGVSDVFFKHWSAPTGRGGDSFLFFKVLVRPTGLGGGFVFCLDSPNGSGRGAFFFFLSIGSSNGSWGRVCFKYWFAQRVWRGFGCFFQALVCSNR